MTLKDLNKINPNIKFYLSKDKPTLFGKYIVNAKFVPAKNKIVFGLSKLKFNKTFINELSVALVHELRHKEQLIKSNYNYRFSFKPYMWDPDEIDAFAHEIAFSINKGIKSNMLEAYKINKMKDYRGYKKLMKKVYLLTKDRF
jgi:hypothetical protein